MFERVTEQEKRHRFPTVPDYSTASSELYSSSGELTCFAMVDTSSTVKQRRSSGLSYFWMPEYFMWVRDSSNESTTAQQQSSASALRLLKSHPRYIHVFARRTSGEDWFDIGKGLMCGYSGSGPTVAETCIREFDIQLATRLPEPLWIEFGGHPGWYLTINNEESEVFTPEAVMDAIRNAWDRPPVDVQIGRYSGDGLFAIADESGRATMSYWLPDKSEFVSGTPQLLDITVPTLVFHRSNRYDHEVAMSEVISQEEAMRIIESFVLTGKPTGLTPLAVLHQKGDRAANPNP